MSTKIIFRNSLVSQYELCAAADNFECAFNRTATEPNDLIIGRYSIWPFYKEFEEDVKHLGGKLINRYAQHLYVADLQNWYEDLQEFTPKTWDSFTDITDSDGPFVLKGETNSYKNRWNSHMYANDRKEAIEVMLRLQQDRFLENQKICIRKYVPLRNLGTGINELQISEEYRFFVLDGKILCSGFYWTDVIESIPKDVSPSNVPTSFLDKIIRLVGDSIRFYVIDVARTKNNEWIVIELNDGQYSGLCGCDPKILYSNIKKALRNG